MSLAMSGVTVPTVNYSNSISEEFPNTNRRYKVESAISSRYYRDHLPINVNFSNGGVSENYIEFVLNGNTQDFYDLESFALELKLKIKNHDGSDLPDDATLTLIDGAGHRILSKCSLYLNGVPCESNAYFGLYNSIKTYLGMSKSELQSIGRNMYYKSMSTKIYDNITNASFENRTADETDIQAECRNVIHLMIPIGLEISSSGIFLMNGVDIRLRFDLSPASLMINTAHAQGYKYDIETAKLWTQKIVPNPDALFSLSKSLLNNNSSIEYVFERPVIKSFVLPLGQTNLSFDNIFNGIIPHKLCLFFIRQSAVSGNYAFNGAYLSSCNISSLQLQLNGNIVTSLNTSFPHNIANVFHHTLINNGDIGRNLLSLKTYREGRTIFVWDLRASDSSDTIPLERSGNLRLSIQLSTANRVNYIVYVVGVTNGLISVDAGKRVRTSYLM